MGRPQQLKPKPSSVVLFVGPPLVGKDEMIKLLTKVMTTKDVQGTVRYISPSEVLRWSTNPTIQRCRDENRPIPQEVVSEVMNEQIIESLRSVHLTAIDDYPRGMEEARDMIAMLQKNRVLRPVCVHLIGTFNLFTGRLATHIKNKGYDATLHDKMTERWEEYRRSCETMIPYLRQVTQYVEINPESLEEKKREPLDIFASMWALMGHHVTELTTALA